MNAAPNTKLFFNSKLKEVLQALETLKNELEVQWHLLSMDTKDQSEDLKKKFDSVFTNLKKIQTKTRASLEEEEVQWHLATMELKDFWETLSPSLASLEGNFKKKALGSQQAFNDILQRKIKKVQGYFSHE